MTLSTWPEVATAGWSSCTAASLECAAAEGCQCLVSHALHPPGCWCRFQSKLAFAEVGTGASSTAEDFGVASRPTLVVVGADGQRHTYSGRLGVARRPCMQELEAWGAATAAV